MTVTRAMYLTASSTSNAKSFARVGDAVNCATAARLAVKYSRLLRRASKRSLSDLAGEIGAMVAGLQAFSRPMGSGR